MPPETQVARNLAWKGGRGGGGGGGGGGGEVGAAEINWYKKTAKIGLKFIFIEANKNYLSRQSPHWILLE